VLTQRTSPDSWLRRSIQHDELFCLAVLCIVVRLTFADSNAVLLASFESQRLGMLRPVFSAVDNGEATIRIQTNVGRPRRRGTERGTQKLPTLPTGTLIPLSSLSVDGFTLLRLLRSLHKREISSVAGQREINQPASN
jgi:hypothetical protein